MLSKNYITTVYNLNYSCFTQANFIVMNGADIAASQTRSLSLLCCCTECICRPIKLAFVWKKRHILALKHCLRPLGPVQAEISGRAVPLQPLLWPNKGGTEGRRLLLGFYHTCGVFIFPSATVGPQYRQCPDQPDILDCGRPIKPVFILMVD